MPGSIRTHEVTPNLWPDVEALFSPVHGCDGCWCMNHRDEKLRGEPAHHALQHAIQEDQIHGVLAYVGPAVAGWCAVDPRESLKGHDATLPFDGQANAHWAIHCFYVASFWRGRGVAGKLADAAIELARRREATVLEAYPTPPNDAGHCFDFSGRYKMFESRGFTLTERISDDFCRMELKL